MTELDDLSLTRRLAALMGWEVVGPALALMEYDFSSTHVYIDQEGRYYRQRPGRPRAWRPWRPLDSMDDAKQIIGLLQQQGWHYELGSCIGGGHYAAFGRGNYNHVTSRWETHHTAQADQVERALCLAALKAFDARAGEINDE